MASLLRSVLLHSVLLRSVLLRSVLGALVTRLVASVLSSVLLSSVLLRSVLLYSVLLHSVLGTCIVLLLLWAYRTADGTAFLGLLFFVRALFEKRVANNRDRARARRARRRRRARVERVVVRVQGDTTEHRRASRRSEPLVDRRRVHIVLRRVRGFLEVHPSARLRRAHSHRNPRRGVAYYGALRSQDPRERRSSSRRRKVYSFHTELRCHFFYFFGYALPFLFFFLLAFFFFLFSFFFFLFGFALRSFSLLFCFLFFCFFDAMSRL